MTARPPSRFERAKSSGHALAGTMIFLALVLMLQLSVQQQTASAIRVEQAARQHAAQSAGGVRALATGLTLLETGLPPDDDWSCRINLPPAGQPNDPFCAAVPTDWILTFRKDHGHEWNVSVRPASDDDNTLPAAPATFLPAP